VLAETGREEGRAERVASPWSDAPWTHLRPYLVVLNEHKQLDPTGASERVLEYSCELQEQLSTAQLLA
jgi:hypothetical protein